VVRRDRISFSDKLRAQQKIAAAGKISL